MAQNIFLDVDPSIVENNLRFTDDDKEFKKLLGDGFDKYPSKVVKPHPGFCVKTKERDTDTKVFVNICKIDAIPPPRDITEHELTDIMDSDSSDFKIPMSIGDLRMEKDKKGSDAKVYDVAIHPNFFDKIVRYQSFKNFFLAVVFQGLENKYGLKCADEMIILNNRKAYGTLQAHRIQQREIDEKMGRVPAKTALDEMTGETQKSKNVVIETISTVEFTKKVPDYRIYKRKSGPNCLIGEFLLPNVVSTNELTLDVGEDRIVLESSTYLLDIFVPYFIRNEKCTCAFDQTTKILTLQMPLVGG
ncbi:PIH1 domain-containing protein 1 [Cylas formicarius]|uniref:PIH1 domain-containing protein 1 n=1 Tax=Cylas formicarius TaxID=197179 RepID=UPI0029585807|nr:PIH1 domain-containing protein 1 [Cylas formicarius]